MLSASQNLLSPNLSSIAVDFGYTDTQSRDTYMGSYLSLAYSVFSIPAGIFVGILTDKQSTNRSKALAISTLLGGLANLFTGFCSHYHELFLLRLISGYAISPLLVRTITPTQSP